MTAETAETAETSRIPPPEPVSLDPGASCVLVLDLTPRPGLASPDAERFLARVGAFLERARRAGVPVVFTASLSERGTDVVDALLRRDDEPVFHPDAFDKLRSEDLRSALAERGCSQLVVVGAAANHAVMNTVIGAARHFPFSVYVPLDGVHAVDPYAYEYALFHLSHLPRSARPPRFTLLDSITFAA